MLFKMVSFVYIILFWLVGAIQPVGQSPWTTESSMLISGVWRVICRCILEQISELIFTIAENLLLCILFQMNSMAHWWSFLQQARCKLKMVMTMIMRMIAVECVSQYIFGICCSFWLDFVIDRVIVTSAVVKDVPAEVTPKDRPSAGSGA